MSDVKLVLETQVDGIDGKFVYVIFVPYVFPGLFVFVGEQRVQINEVEWDGHRYVCLLHDESYTKQLSSRFQSCFDFPKEQRKAFVESLRQAYLKNGWAHTL